MNFEMLFQLLNSSNPTSTMVIILIESARGVGGWGKRWESNYEDVALNIFCFGKACPTFKRITYFQHNTASWIGLDIYRPPTSSKFYLNESINLVFSCHFDDIGGVGGSSYWPIIKISHISLRADEITWNNTRKLEYYNNSLAVFITHIFNDSAFPNSYPLFSNKPL